MFYAVPHAALPLSRVRPPPLPPLPPLPPPPSSLPPLTQLGELLQIISSSSTSLLSTLCGGVVPYLRSSTYTEQAGKQASERVGRCVLIMLQVRFSASLFASTLRASLLVYLLPAPFPLSLLSLSLSLSLPLIASAVTSFVVAVLVLY